MAGAKWTIDLKPRFLQRIVGRTQEFLAEEMQAEALRLVAIDTGDLQRSITIVRPEKPFSLYAIESNLPYALAQEYGRPDLPRYRYTPYMGPAFRKVSKKWGSYGNSIAVRKTDVSG